jgi:hypothetical protein
MYLHLFSHTDPVERSVAAFRPLGVVGQSGVVLPERLVQVRDVPADGDCLFHSLGREISHYFAGNERLPPNPGSGKSWRDFLMNYVRTTSDAIDGTSIQDWIALVTRMDIDEYIHSMRLAGNRDTWGGFMEASLLWKAWSAHSGSQGHVVMLECVEAADGSKSYRVLAWAGSDDPKSFRICIAWLGNHWVRARLTAEARRLIEEWRGRT